MRHLNYLSRWIKSKLADKYINHKFFEIFLLLSFKYLADKFFKLNIFLTKSLSYKELNAGIFENYKVRI